MTADINPPPLTSEPVFAPPAPRKFSKLAVAGFLLAIIAIPAGVLLGIGLFRQLFEGPGDEAGPMLAGLFGASILGFLAGIFGSVSLRRMRGPAPEYRGRALALVATAGVRGVLLATALAFAAVPIGGWFGNMGGRGGVEIKTVQACWWVGSLLVCWYVGSMIRRAKRPARGGGWAALVSGIVFHLLLFFIVPSMMVAAFVSLQQGFNGRQGNRNYGPSLNGLYATRDVMLKLPVSPETPVTVRLWEKGQSKDVASLNLSGSVRYRWTLSETPSGDHSLSWMPVRKGGSSESRPLELPSDLDLVPAGDRLDLSVAAGNTARVWLFLPYEQATALQSPIPAPDWGVELVIGTMTDTVR